MKINRNNYEACFIDYLEGNLNETLIDNFIEFLQQNPDLKEELAFFETISVEPENISFHKKNKLYKEKYDSEKEFNKSAIADLEGDLSKSEKEKFDNFILTHPEKEKDIAIFAKTKLIADESITFNKKNKLYHYSLGRSMFLRAGRVAAILILVLTVFTLINKRSSEIIPENKIVVENTPIKTTDKSKTRKTQIETKQKEEKQTKKTTPKPEIKKAVPAKKTNKSLRENTKGRMEHKDIAIIRTPVEVPAEMYKITASLEIRKPEFTLAAMNLKSTNNKNEFYEERLLADIVKEKTGLDKIKFNKITKAGLNLVANITKDNFTYETNDEGKVVEYKYDSRLLAFSIPTKNE